MRKIFVVFGLLLILASVVFCACPYSYRQVYVPAVVTGQEGGLLQVVVRTEPGNGTVFTEIDPIVGASTQLSQAKAVEQAFESTEFLAQECNVYFGFDGLGLSPAVDGPSAGLAMTVALKSALEGTQIREDIAITGAILSEEQVGQVGGIIDKAQAASRMGKKILISPKHAIYENILLSKLSDEYDFVALEASTLDEAYEIATSAEGKKYESNFELEASQVPKSLPQRELNSDDERFAKVAGAINEGLLGKASFEQEGTLGTYTSHFQQEAEQNRKIIELGYGYTAANNAFLSQIDAAFLTTPPHELDLATEILVAQECIEQIPRVEPTVENLEWVAGANARRNWAITKVEEIINMSNDYDSQEGKYLALREVYFARSWCLASTEIQKQAIEIGGTALDEDALQSYAKVRVNEVAKLVERSIVKNPESLWHLEVANKSLQKGDYAGAIFDSAYASAMQGATNNENEMGEEEIEEIVRYLAVEEYDGLWGRTYQSQGVYTLMQSIENERPTMGSHGVLRLAQTMEEMLKGAKISGSNPPITVEVGQAKKEAGLEATAVMVVVWGSIILLVGQLASSVFKNK